jgi:hypothetical protein
MFADFPLARECQSGGTVEFDGGGVAEGVEDAEHQVGGDGVENGNGKMEITRLMTWSANGPRCGGWVFGIGNWKWEVGNWEERG